MDQERIDSLYNIADEFGSIAKMVNESSKKRKSHSDDAIQYIEKSYEIGKILKEDIDKVSKANIHLRNQDNIVLNTSKILNINVNKQLQLLEELKNKNSISEETSEVILSKINGLNSSLAEAMSNVQKIIELDNEIIMMDSLLSMQKEFQQESIEKLKKLTEKSQEDAKKAIKGSSSNLERGLNMAKRFKNVITVIEKNNKNELMKYIDEANKGWNIAVDVNESSKSQFEFAEAVNQFTKKLHSDSLSIKDMVAEKHKLFESNLQNITVLTVVIFLKFKKYLDIEEILDDIHDSDQIHDLLNDFIAHVKVACKDIKDIITMNYDMTDSILLNNEIENKTVELTEKEIEYYNGIKNEVEEMTKATKYPVEGSGKNIKNGQLLENALKEIANQINS